MSDNDPAESVVPWNVLSSRYSFEDQWLRVRSDSVELSNGKILSPYHVLEFPDWVCAVVVTSANEIVLVQQYRHGAGQVMTELPAGIVSEAEREEPLAAMKRELLEETGFTSEKWYPLGTYFANGARQINKVHAFLVIDAAQTFSQSLDDGEIILPHIMPWAEFRKRFLSGRINLSACHLACILWMQLFAVKSESDRLRQLRL